MVYRPQAAAARAETPVESDSEEDASEASDSQSEAEARLGTALPFDEDWLEAELAELEEELCCEEGFPDDRD